MKKFFFLRKSNGNYHYPCRELARIIVSERIVRRGIESLDQNNKHLSDVISNIKPGCLECREYINLEGLSQRSIDLSNEIRDIKRKFSTSNNNL